MRRISAIILAVALAACSNEDQQPADRTAAESIADRAQHKDENTAPGQLSAKPAAAEKPLAASTHPCLIDGDKPVPANQIKALGNEPFWAARIQGRCVTYLTPDDQQGTRVWTRFSSAGEARTWSGALRGRRFEIRIRPQPGCSDGMSDERYPMAAELFVDGERRTGCAEPL